MIHKLEDIKNSSYLGMYIHPMSNFVEDLQVEGPCVLIYFIMEPDEELFGDSEEQTFDQEILSRPSNSSQETESERLIRTGEMTPFGSIASSSSQTEVKAKPEKSGEDCVHMQESIEPKVCVNIYVCTT